VDFLIGFQCLSPATTIIQGCIEFRQRQTLVRVAGFILDITSPTLSNLKMSKNFPLSVLASVYHSSIMKYLLCLAALAFCSTKAVAFPSRMFDMDINEMKRRNRF
jgi:hypothetical protein